MSASDMSDEKLAVLSRRIFRMRDSKSTMEETAESLDLTVDEMIAILEEAEERGIVERPS